MKILLIDDHPIIRAGLKRLLSADEDTLVVEAATGRQAMALAKSDLPDLIILDLNLPDVGGMELLRNLRRDHAATPILVLTMHAEPLYASRALELGAKGYVTKNANPTELLAAVKQVAAGGRYLEQELAQTIALQVAGDDQLGRLNARDLEIMRLLAAGRSLAEIAAALGVGYKTVANGCTQLKAKLGVTRTNDLVRLALETGVL